MLQDILIYSLFAKNVRHTSSYNVTLTLLRGFMEQSYFNISNVSGDAIFLPAQWTVCEQLYVTKQLLGQTAVNYTIVEICYRMEQKGTF